MAILHAVRGHKPVHGKNCWFAPNCTIVGEVDFGDSCTVWFNAVVRGDVNFIKVGNNTNIQDNVTIHGTFEKAGTTLGNNVTIGHNAVVHGCTIHDDALIGIGAVILDNAVVGEGAIVGAGAVVLEGSEVAPNTVVGGTPAKFLKKLDDKNRDMLSRIARNYTTYASWFKESGL